MTGDNEHILAIDLGTSGPKVALVSMDGRVVDSDFEPNDVLYLPGGGAEQRPDDWWNAIVAATRRVMGRGRVAPSDVTAVSCTAQWSGTVAVDRNGDALHNAIIWMDTRGARHVRAATRGLVNVEGYGVTKLVRWLRVTGGIPTGAGKDPIAHILWLKAERPEIYEATSTFLEPKDYLNLRLTGKVAATFDSIALHWVTDNRDIENVRYDERLLARVGLPRAKLPDLLPATTVIGTLTAEAAQELGLQAETAVIGGTPDTYSAAVGSGAVRDFEGHYYIGTSSWLLCHTPYKKTDILHNMASLPAPLPGRYLLMNEQETSGACLTFLRDNVLFADDELGRDVDRSGTYAAFDRIAATVPPGSDKVIFTPWLYGERTPIENPSVRACFFNLAIDNSRAHMIRAVFEGVAYNARWLLGYVERFTKRRMDGLRVIGGGVRSELWCQILADVLDRDIHQVDDPIHANLRGAAFLAALALGRIRVDDIPERVPIARTFRPDPANRAIYDELFREYLNLYRQTRGIYARLNRV